MNDGDEELLLLEQTSNAIFSCLSSGETVLQNQDEKVIDAQQLPEKTRKKYQRNLAIMQKISNVYGPTYLGLIGKTPKPIITELSKEYSTTRQTIWRIIKQYLRSGCQMSCFVTDAKSKDRSNVTHKKLP